MQWTRIEGPAYSVCIVAVFIAIAIWETSRPLRGLSAPAERRWRNHGVMFVAALIVPLVLRVTPVALAVAVSGSPWGVLNKPWLPLALRYALAIVLMDGLQYWIHWSLHHVSLLWRIHQVHHSDQDYDVSTAARFHPLEVLWTQGLHLAAIAWLAPPAGAMLIYVLLTEAVNFTTHANASLPSRIDRILRLFLVTPDMHRIHHSEDMQEQRRNLGQTFAWWDRLFRSYQEKPAAQGTNFRTGLEELRDHDTLAVAFMLSEPFKKLRQEDPEAASRALSPE